MEEKLNKMDKIVSDLCANVVNQKNINGEIELVGFDQNDYGHLLYFECALIMAAWHEEKVYISLPLLQYLKLKFKYKKARKYIRRKELAGEDTINEILAYVCEKREINYTFYKEIYEEYYEVKKNAI